MWGAHLSCWKKKQVHVWWIVEGKERRYVATVNTLWWFIVRENTEIMLPTKRFVVAFKSTLKVIFLTKNVWNKNMHAPEDIQITREKTACLKGRNVTTAFFSFSWTEKIPTQSLQKSINVNSKAIKLFSCCGDTGGKNLHLLLFHSSWNVQIR